MTASSTPLAFSIVIPTYNRADLIEHTLRSVSEQDFGSFEVIVVDDGSTDNTEAVVQAAVARDSRITYMRKVNGERGAARNFGFRQAAGEYVLFLDSDDLLHPNHLSTLRAGIEAHNRPNFIATKYDFDRDGVRAPSDMAGLSEGWYGLDTFVRGNVLACNVCVRRANPNLHLFEEDRRYAAVEDWMFMLENTQQDRIYIMDAVTLTMNDHDARSMRSDNSALVRRLQLALEWMLAHVKLTPAQRGALTGRVYYLCAIHAYADGHRQQALSYARRAQPGLSRAQSLLLLARILIGPGIIGLLKRIRG